MKKLMMGILCLMMLLTSVSALAALDPPDPAKKPDMVSVDVKEDADHYLLLTVSDGKKNYQVDGYVYTSQNSSTEVSFQWNDEKAAYVSSQALEEYTDKIQFIDIYAPGDEESISYRIYSPDSTSDKSYVRVYSSERKEDSSGRIDTSDTSYYYTDGSSRVEKAVYAYDADGKRISDQSESANYNKNHTLTQESERNEIFKDGSHTGSESLTLNYSPSTGKVTHKNTSKGTKGEGDNWTYVYSSENYSENGLLTSKSSRTSGNDIEKAAYEYYYDDGSLRYRYSDNSETNGNKTIVTGDRYNSRNELVFAKRGTRTIGEDGTSRDITYTDASGAKIGWDVYDAATGKTEQKIPSAYYIGNELQSVSSEQYVQSGDVATWKQYSYDPQTGAEKELVTNYKGLKLYEASWTKGNGTGTEYWLRTQKPNEETKVSGDRTENRLLTTRGMEWRKRVTADSGNYTVSYYNSLGELTYKVENEKTYYSQDGKLRELEEDLGIRTGNRYNVIGFYKDEEIEGGYKTTYYHLDKALDYTFEHTSIEKGDKTTETDLYTYYDAQGEVTELDRNVTVQETLENGSRETVIKNDVITGITERLEENGISTYRSKEFDEKTGIMTWESENISGSGIRSTYESRSYDSRGNLANIHRRVSLGNTEQFQDTDANGALISRGTSFTENGWNKTKEYWAVGSTRFDSEWYNDGLMMSNESVGTSSRYYESGNFNKWYTVDAEGNSSSWDYWYDDNQVSQIEDVTYQPDGVKATHVQTFNRDGTTRYWNWKDESEDGLYVTEQWWDGDGTLLWTKVTEATKEGSTETTTDPSGNARVVKYDMEGNQVSESTNWSGNGWKNVFGEWKYLENGEEVTDWKNINGQWYYFTGDGDMVTGHLVEELVEQADGTTKPQGVYVFDKNGNWLNTPGWCEDSYGYWSYVLADGQAATGWRNIDGTWYYFNDGGYMYTGDVTLDGYTYHLNKDGAWVTLSGWVQDSGDGFWKHYTNDVKDTGWLKDDSWYYLSGDTGSMVKDAWLELDDKWYLFDESGAMQTGWVEKGGSWYYLEGTGALADGWVQDGGKYYYMTQNGMATGWQEIDGNWEFFNADGSWSYTWTPAEE